MNVRDDTQKIPLPRYLQEHREEILHVFKTRIRNTRGWGYDAKAWRSVFADNPAVNDDLSKIIDKCEKCSGRITRRHVQSFACKIRSGNYPEIRRLFLACMIWGYGPDPNGPDNTKLALSDPRLEAVLEKSVERIKNTRIKEAYEGFTLRDCRSAFFTKFFYFVGKEYNIEPLPLILDSHVANFLEFLGKQEGWDISTFVEVNNRKKNGRISSIEEYPEGYIQYICSMHDWATKLGCPADDNIERFMYCKDKECEQKQKEESIPANGIMWKRDGAHCFYCDELLASPPFHNINIKEILGRHVCKH